MARCAVAGCGRPLRWRGRRLAQHVTDLDAYFPALERLRRLARADRDDLQEQELRWTIGIGRGYRWHMHEAAHGDRYARTLIPTRLELDDWQIEATRTAKRLVG